MPHKIPAVAVRIAAFLVAAVPVLGQQRARPPATFCAGQDQIFARNFDSLAALFLAAACLAIPTVLMFLTARWWWMTRWFWRGALPAAALTVLILTVFVGFPWFAVRDILPPEVGLFAYPGVDGRYLACTDESFQCAGVVFGLFGPQRGALVYNPGLLILTVMAAAALGIGVFWGAFTVTRRMKGLARG